MIICFVGIELVLKHIFKYITMLGLRNVDCILGHDADFIANTGQFEMMNVKTFLNVAIRNSAELLC